MSIHELPRKNFPEYSIDPRAVELVNNNKDLQTALRASYIAGTMLREAFTSSYETHVQADRSEFTPFDEQAETIASIIIRERDPAAIIMGEELSPNEDITQGDFWVIDGIDGTTNFARRIPVCNFTMAKVEKGITQVGIVYDFLQQNMYFAVRDKGAYRNGERLKVSTRHFNESVITFAPLRNSRNRGIEEANEVEATWDAMRNITNESNRFHREFQSGGLELSWVATGQLDGYASSWTSPWDLSAGVLLVREAGGVATNIKGEEWQPSYMGVVAGNPEVHSKMLAILQKHFYNNSI